MRRWISIIWCCSIIVVFNCSRPSPQSSKKLTIFVSIPPQKFLVEKICGNRCIVKSFVPPGASPHTFEPKPSQMVEIAKATLYFVVGVEMEHVWLPRIKEINPHLKIVATDSGIIKLPMRKLPHTHHEAVHPTHSEQRDEKHGYYDPHIWLSPPLVKIQAEHILDGLRQSDPIHAEIYETNFRRFSEEIDRLDADLHRLFSGLGRVRFLVFHPSWGYFAEAYGLEQIPIEFEGKDPKPAALQALIKEATSDGIKVIFVQPQFSTRSAETIANAIGGEVMIADPLAADWEENLRRQAVKIKSALK